MVKRSLIRAAGLAVLILSAGLATSAPVTAAGMQAQMIKVTASDAGARFVPLGIGKSIVIDLPDNVKDVLVADPKIANAVMRSPRRAYLIGVAVGQTNIYFFDAHGHQIAGFDIAVTRDLNGLRGALRRVIPDARIQVEGMADGVILSGTAPTPQDAQQAYDIAARLVGSTQKVVNAIKVEGRQEVMLKVTVAEVERNVIKQLGINLNASLGYGTVVFSTNNQFPASGTTPANTFKAQMPIGSSGNTIGATLQAMDQAGVIRTLAQPTLTAISGETANFLAGGEFPVVTSAGGPPNYTPTVQFKKFGVSLNFTPVVLTGGRISLKVETEVSQLSNEGAVQIQGFSIPSLKTRRAETTVEIPSGGSLAMAGMLQRSTKEGIEGVPGLLQIPVLGALFRSRDYVNDKTELMILVTPYVVHAVAANKLSRPDDGFENPSDPASVLLGHLNRIYGNGAVPGPSQHYHGKYGFILD